MCSANQVVYNMESKKNNFWNVLEIFASLKLGTVKKEKNICVKRIRGNKSLSSKLMRNTYNMYAYLQYGINKSLYSNENHMDRTPIYEYVMFHMFICKLAICSLFFFWSCHVTYRISVPQPGTELTTAVKARNSNHQATRKFL